LFKKKPPLVDLPRIGALIRANREALLVNWRAQVRALPTAKHMDTPTLTDHIPILVDELAVAFETSSDAKIEVSLKLGSSPAHGSQRVLDGFNIGEVVAEYNILRGCVHDLVVDSGLSLEGRAFHVLNQVLDGAIGLAVETYAVDQAQEVLRRREEYLAFVAHDLRTPLNAIALAARVLEHTLATPGATGSAEMLKTLGRNVNHLKGLVSKVIEENSSLETEVGVKLERRHFDLWPLVEGLIHDLHPVAGTSSTALINNVPDDLVVFADASLLTRVFQNLIANAIAYTPRGEVRISARTDAIGAVVCWVSDNGEGIAADALKLIFEKGQADPTREESKGLGLTIVKTFIEAHGGTVSAESPEGHGTTIRFTLPKAPG
jgi:two-component system phosphate regulon sensor histidine kinase PhoR